MAKSRRKKFTTMTPPKKYKQYNYPIAKKAAVKKKVAKPGTGARFTALKKTVGARKGKGKVTNPGALAAFIGRKKFGAAKFAKMSAAGKK